MDHIEFDEYGDVVAPDEELEISTYDLKEAASPNRIFQLPLFDMPEQKSSRHYLSYLDLYLEDYRRRRSGEDTRAWRWEMTNRYSPETLGKMWYTWRESYDVTTDQAAA